jgi:hypothetical protein
LEHRDHCCYSYSGDGVPIPIHLGIQSEQKQSKDGLDVAGYWREIEISIYNQDFEQGYLESMLLHLTTMHCFLRGVMPKHTIVSWDYLLSPYCINSILTSSCNN